MKSLIINFVFFFIFFSTSTMCFVYNVQLLLIAYCILIGHTHDDGAWLSIGMNNNNNHIMYDDRPDERDAIQKKTFTKWVNKHLKKVKIKLLKKKNYFYTYINCFQSL